MDRTSRTDSTWAWSGPLVCGLLLVALVWFKWSFLALPFYWDEAWVYAPAVRAMSITGPGLLPDALPVELSRGHPLLFHFLASTWASVFGTSSIALHAFALLVAGLLGVATYRLGAVVGHPSLGLVALCLLFANESFLAQSAILLPELLLTLFLVLAVNSYLLKKPVSFVVFAVAALLTKETALTLVVALLASRTVDLLLTKDHAQRRSAIQGLGLAILPLAIAALFFVVQWFQRGWFFYPDHLGMMTYGWRDIIYKAKLIFQNVFENQGILPFTYAVAIIAPLVQRAVPVWKRLLTALLLVAAIKVLFGRWSMPEWGAVPFVLACLAAVHLLFLRPFKRVGGPAAELIDICFLLVVAVWGFTSLNFYTDRYLVCLVPFVAVGGLAVLDKVLGVHWKWSAHLVGLCTAVYMVTQIGADGTVGDTKLAYKDGIAVHQRVVGHCIEQGWMDDPISGSFMDVAYLTDSTAGYLPEGMTFRNVADRIDPATVAAIVSYESPMERTEELRAAGFVRSVRFEEGQAWAEVHVRQGAITLP